MHIDLGLHNTLIVNQDIRLLAIHVQIFSQFDAFDLYLIHQDYKTRKL